MLPDDRAIAKALAPFGVALTKVQAESVREYIRLLLLWNHRINLSRIVDPLEILARHFGESMFAAARLPICGGRLADVGTGAGFPGLALKIFCMDLEVFLIESHRKKATFLSEVVRRLGLTGVGVLPQRMEGIQDLNSSLDFVTSRAVGQFHELLSWSGRVLRHNGQVVLWVGSSDAEVLGKTAGWEWKNPISIPNTKNSVLLAGESGSSR